jgi:hypothetical protein
MIVEFLKVPLRDPAQRERGDGGERIYCSMHINLKKKPKFMDKTG